MARDREGVLRKPETLPRRVGPSQGGRLSRRRPIYLMQVLSASAGCTPSQGGVEVTSNMVVT